MVGKQQIDGKLSHALGTALGRGGRRAGVYVQGLGTVRLKRSPRVRSSAVLGAVLSAVLSAVPSTTRGLRALFERFGGGDHARFGGGDLARFGGGDR
jgi:hypothetical protein